MNALDTQSGTGPDELPATILKMCCEELKIAIALLTLRIIATGIWPDCWKVHWIAPLYKRAAIFKGKNYRGIHLTAQVSKVVERLIKPMVEPHLEQFDWFGPN